jgi:uncharacterized protein
MNNPNIRVIIKAIVFWILFVTLLFGMGSITPLFSKTYYTLATGVFGSLIALVITRLFLWREKKSFRDVGLYITKSSLPKFLLGFLIGTVIIGLMVLVLVNFTTMRFTRNNVHFEYAVYIGYLAIFPLALMEELAFRAYPFVRLNQKLGFRLTQVIVAIAFALYHVAAGQSVYSSFLGPGIWAFTFGLLAYWSGGIAMPLGLHVAANLLQSIIGLKTTPGSLWTLEFTKGSTPEALAQVEQTGWIMHMGFLAVTLFLMEYYMNRKKEGAALRRTPS